MAQPKRAQNFAQAALYTVVVACIGRSNGAPVKAFKYDKGAKSLTVTLPAGEGMLTY